MHLLVNRKHSRNYDTESGSAAAHPDARSGNDTGHDTDANDIVLN